MKRIVCITSFIFSALAWPAIQPRPVPRKTTHKYFNDGIFEGGKTSKTNLISLFIQSREENYERWVFDFSPAAHSKRPMPKFQIRYLKGETYGSRRTPPRMIFTFQTIEQNRLRADLVKNLLKRTRLVNDIVIYPPVDDGDTAIEIVLKDNVVFSPRQPLEPLGRLIVDLKRV